MKLQLAEGVELETNSMEFSYYTQINGILASLLEGKMTRAEADKKIEFLINLANYVSQEAELRREGAGQ
jgi:hypothetical protein